MVTEHFPVRVLGGPTAVFEYGGLRFLTDPTFDDPGEYGRGEARSLRKTAPASGRPEELGRIDVVLLSHDEHPDNLDIAGRALLAEVPLTLTTPGGAQRLGGNAKGLADWEPIQLARPTTAGSTASGTGTDTGTDSRSGSGSGSGSGTITVTGVPAVHGPGAREDVEPITGQVVGFVLTGEDLPTVYVSGDNASLAAVQEIADRFGPIDTALLFAGAPRIPALFDGIPLVLDSAQAAEAARLLDARRVVPVHYDSWSHFSEGRDELVAAFTAAGLADRLDLGLPQ
ncbi:MBL fold metallo-hydrolase [Kribbella sp. DT2]|uniref:MBL fold metallo-hydrolase n=1 Tax=Kribbella sp. DT2 TaxID=3393427 RepID=UPI003CF9E8F0